MLTLHVMTAPSSMLPSILLTEVSRSDFTWATLTRPTWPTEKTAIVGFDDGTFRLYAFKADISAVDFAYTVARTEAMVRGVEVAPRMTSLDF